MSKEQSRDKNGRFKKMQGQEAPKGKTKTVTFELHHCGDVSEAEQIKFERDVYKNLSENLASKNLNLKKGQRDLLNDIEALRKKYESLLSKERNLRGLYVEKDHKIAIAHSFLEEVIASHSFIFNKTLRGQLRKLIGLIYDAWYV